MSSRHREVEDKYDVGPDAVLDGLARLPGVAAVAPAVELDMEATYFDTADLALAAAGITLRRRTGGEDAGWHLKLPTKDARMEVRLPLARATRTVPKQLRDTVQVLTRGRPLRPVTVVRNHRTAHRLLGADGRVLAEVADDRVRAEPPGRDGDADSRSAAPTSWREWEVELADGGPDLLVAAAGQLRGLGARPARVRSKLARALGDRVPDRRRAPSRRTRHDPAAAVVRARLVHQVDALRRNDPLVHQDLPEGVHQMRVAIRRLRSALATFRPLLDRAVTDPVRDELRWLANELGGARDLEVQGDRLATRLAELTSDGRAELVRGPVRTRVEQDLGEWYDEARRRATDALRSDRYFALLDGLDRLAAAPPWTERAQRPAGKVLPARVRHDWKRLRVRVAAARGVADPAERAARLHEARKAAKRVRYAVEPLVPVYGKDAKRLVKAVKPLQTVLGDHHDAVVAQGLLRELSDRAAAAGENAFTYGVLAARMDQEIAACEERFDAAWAAASRKKLRRWLT